MSDLQVGQTVLLNDGRTAIVRFVGQTHFAASEWVGVELEDDTGKNDGSVQGERYFDCPAGRGMFIRPAAVASIQAAPAVKAVPARKPSRASNVMPSSGRQSAMNDPSINKRMSMNAPSPSPVPRASRPSSMVRVGLTYHRTACLSLIPQRQLLTQHRVLLSLLRNNSHQRRHRAQCHLEQALRRTLVSLQSAQSQHDNQQ